MNVIRSSILTTTLATGLFAAVALNTAQAQNILPSLSDTPGGNWLAYDIVFSSTDPSGATAGAPDAYQFEFAGDTSRNGSVSGYAGNMHSETYIVDVEGNAFFENLWIELNHYYDFGDSLGTSSLNFSGNLSNVVPPDTLANGAFQIFVKTFNPGYAGLNAGSVFQDIAADGSFSITTANPVVGPTQVGFLILDHANTTGLGLTPGSFDFDSLSVEIVPEPTTFALAGLGAAALLIFRRRR